MNDPKQNIIAFKSSKFQQSNSNKIIQNSIKQNLFLIYLKYFIPKKGRINIYYFKLTLIAFKVQKHLFITRENKRSYTRKIYVYSKSWSVLFKLAKPVDVLNLLSLFFCSFKDGFFLVHVSTTIGLQAIWFSCRTCVWDHLADYIVFLL